ncbi:MAG: nucleotide sugar dehydrogenase [bacterium]|nr:nucleotide sugar dehydrogenase [bacterium]
MNILYIGSGFVGACSAAVSADSGHKVLVYDIDDKKIKAFSSGDRDTVEACIHENGLGDLLIKHKERIEFTTDYKKVTDFLDECDAIFMCLPTPEIGETGESNLQYYYDAAGKLGENLVKRNGGKQNKYIIIINKSTVPITMVDKTQEMMDSAGVKNYGVVSNPEFLVEGQAIEGSIRPDRVVVGAREEKDFAVMRKLYQRFYDSSTVKYIEVNPKEAAAGKLLANFYLFNRLAVCFDVIGRTTEAFDDLQFENIRKIMTSDARIGNWGFYDSIYAGGSCFIKDARSLSHQLQTAGQNAVIVSETYLANKRQLELFIGRAQTDANFDWKDKKVAVIGLAFKKDTNDIRNSPSLNIVHHLKENGVGEVRVFDPAAMEMFKLEFPASDIIKYFKTEFEAVGGADVIIIATDWPQFRGLADVIVNEIDKSTLIMDGRRILQHRYDELQKAGFDIIAVGSPYIRGNK